MGILKGASIPLRYLNSGGVNTLPAKWLGLFDPTAKDATTTALHSRIVSITNKRSNGWASTQPSAVAIDHQS